MQTIKPIGLDIAKSVFQGPWRSRGWRRGCSPAVEAAQARTPNGGLVLIPDGFLNVPRVKITLLAAQHHLPAVYPWRYFAELGGVLSYGADQA